MVELRKRKTPAQPPAPEKKSKTSQNSQDTANEEPHTPSDVDPPSVGDTINLEGFGGEVETNDGTKTTLQELVKASNWGVVLFTYPRASTPGCTRQACLFRDNHDSLNSSGLSIYGLSADSPKANTSFQTKQTLPYPLLCDRNATLIAALGFKKVPKGTARGVFVVNKDGKVLLRLLGGPEATIEAVQKLMDTQSKENGGENKPTEPNDGGGKPASAESKGDASESRPTEPTGNDEKQPETHSKESGSDNQPAGPADGSEKPQNTENGSS